MSTYDVVHPLLLSAGHTARGLFATAVPRERHSRVTDPDDFPTHPICDADKRIEKQLLESLRKEFPTWGIYSEECGGIEGDGEHRWIIDPIDGTAYFLSGVPHFSICVSLEVAGSITEAFVLNPISNEFYYGNRSFAIATLNGEPIQCSDVTSIADAMIGVGFSANETAIDRYFTDWGEMLRSCNKGLGLLSPALNICNVARGRLDVFVDNGSSMEGQCGAALILEAAGGVVRNYDLTEWDHRSRGIVATNGLLGDMLARYGNA